jgi:hypothetical protein
MMKTPTMAFDFEDFACLYSSKGWNIRAVPPTVSNRKYDPMERLTAIDCAALSAAQQVLRLVRHNSQEKVQSGPT